MTKKHKLVVYGIAGAALMASVVPGAFAAGPLPVRDTVRAAPAAQAGSRIIVKYKDGTAASRDLGAKLRVIESAAGRAQLATKAGKAAPALRAAHARKLGIGADLVKLSQRLPEAQLQRLVDEIKADPSVKYAQVDRMRYVTRPVEKTRAAMVTPDFVPDDQYYAQYQWHFSDPVGGVNAPAAWDISKGEGIVVAVLDTGVIPDHPDLQGNLLEGYDFITDTFVSRRPTNDRVPGAQDYGDWNPVANECYAGSPVTDSSWHGTHTTGTVAEVTNNAIGMAGLAHDAQVLPVRVLGRCGGYTSDIVDAITWASGGTVADVPANANPAEVISMSLGGDGACSAAEQDAIDAAIGRGTTVVAATGNTSTDAANHSPSNCDGVISVSATRINGGIAFYSNWGTSVDISAPGGGGSADGNPGGYVWSAWHDGLTTPESGSPTYVGYIGTSMATPHVAAAVAMVQSALAAAGRDPLSPADMEALLEDTARPFPVSIPASTPIGAGILDVKAALDKALEVPCDPETEVCGPDATPLTNKVPVKNLGGAAGSEALYSFEAEAGGTLSIMTYGGSGDVSVYVSFDAEPTTESYDAKSTRRGNSETVRIRNPQAGTYFIKLVGASGYSGVTLQARQ